MKTSFLGQVPMEGVKLTAVPDVCVLVSATKSEQIQRLLLAFLPFVACL